MIERTSKPAWTALRRGRVFVAAVTLALASWRCSGAGVTSLSDTHTCMLGTSDLLAIAATPGASEVWAARKAW